MKLSTVFCLAATALAAVTSPVLAAEADFNRGRLVAVGGVAAPGTSPNASACFSCHGLTGAGDNTGAFPRLAEQSTWYLYKSLKDYASGSRPNDVMTPIAKALNDQQMQDVSAFYSAQKNVPYAATPVIDPLVLQRGAALSAVGSVERGIQGCVNCHGAAGLGMPPSFPYLAGQPANYLELQLRLWQRDVRRSDPLDVMRMIAKQMSDDDVRATSLYFAAVRPPTQDPVLPEPAQPAHEPAPVGPLPTSR